MENKSGILVSLDITSAFDAVRHDYLFATLRSYGIPEEFIRWIEILYTYPHSQVLNNGYTTHGFVHGRGVRQGDPISPTLYLLAAEILAIAIRKNEAIKGVEIDEKTLKSTQYADDTTIFLKDEESLQPLKELLDKFGPVSGLFINQGKTQCTGLGSKSTENKTVHGFKITPKPLKILGIWFAHDAKMMQDLNVGGKFEKMKSILSSWHTRGLTIQGRILVLKALGLSQLTYALINTVIPNKMLEEINKFIFEFIWNGKKKARIRKDVLIQDYRDGGLKAPDIHSMHTALKYSWIPRLMNGEDDLWALISCKSLEKVGGLKYLLECNYDVKKLQLPTKNSFIGQVLEANSIVNCKNVETKFDVLAQKLNNNKYILIGGKSIFKQTLIDRNMDQIKHWFTDSGEIIEHKIVQNKMGVKFDWLQYLQIKSAIPKSWKRIMKRTDENVDFYKVTPQWVAPKEAKALLIKRKHTAPAGVRTWQNTVPFEPEDEFWTDSFRNIRRITKESKLQVFQYKFIHRIIPTNKFLFRAKLSKTPNCTSCKNTEETMEHMFWDCPTVRKIWEQLIRLFNSVEAEELPNDNIALCMFGAFSRKPTIMRWNYITLVLRFYIYKCRIQNMIPSMRAFKFVLKANLEFLKKIAMQKKTLKQFEEEWSSWTRKMR